MLQSDSPSSPQGTGTRRADAGKTPLNKRAYTLHLTFSVLLTAAIVALLGVSWVFVLGVMVGRGYNPEAKFNEFTERMLHSRQTPAVQEPPQAILKPEDLNFSSALRDRPLYNSSAAAAPPAQAARQTNATASISAAGNSVPQTAQPPTQLVPQGAQPARFDFVYQVATFREMEQADKLRERLEGESVRTAMEKSPARDGKNLYKILALRRGSEEDNRQLLAVLERLKLGLPLLRTKKPVPGGEGAR